MSLLNKSFILAMSGVLALSVFTSKVAQAEVNPFTAQDTVSYVEKKDANKCGEGKCGEGKMKAKGKCGEGKCGEGKKKAKGKCGEGKCGEGKKKAKGKCGEGKNKAK